MRSLVSVVIPSYNRANVLPRAVKSVLAQTYQDFEIIIIDDCSKDNTQEVVKNFNDPRIRYIRHEINKGGNAARNTGIKAANGEFVAFLDSDDEWLPTKLEKQIPLFDNPNVGLVYCGFIFIEQGVGQGEKRLVVCGSDFKEDIFVQNLVGTTSVAVVRKGLLDDIKGFDVALRSCQDWDLYIRLSEICSFACVEQYLTFYHINRKGKNQISTNPASTISGHLLILKKYAQRIKLLPKDKKLQHIDYLLKIFLGAASLKGIPLAWQGFQLSGHLKYILWILKVLIKSLLRKFKIN